MKYLINLEKPKGRAHYWDDVDTFCKMYSTGGMRKKRYKVYDSQNAREICLMCQNAFNEGRMIKAEFRGANE
jgi:hypothetical protein